MNMQDQTRKAFGHYAKHQTARAKAGDLGSPFINSELHPSLRKQVDDYVQPPQADDISFTDMLAGQDKDNLHIDVSGHGSPDVIIARPDVAKELGSMFVNGFGDAAKVVSSDDVGYDFDGDSLPDEKSYSRLAKRGYEAGNLANDYVTPPKVDEYVQPPKVDEYVQSPKDMSFTDALIKQDDNKVYVDDHMRSLVNSSDTIFVTPEAAKEMGPIFVDDFGNRGKVVVVKDQVGKQARDYTAGNLTDDYVQPPKYDDYVQPPKADDYVQPPKADDYVQPPTVSDFDASQFEMASDEATKTIDDEPMSAIDEGQFDIGPSKGLQQ